MLRNKVKLLWQFYPRPPLLEGQLEDQAESRTNPKPRPWDWRRLGLYRLADRIPKRPRSLHSQKRCSAHRIPTRRPWSTCDVWALLPPRPTPRSRRTLPAPSQLVSSWDAPARLLARLPARTQARPFSRPPANVLEPLLIPRALTPKSPARYTHVRARQHARAPARPNAP